MSKLPCQGRTPIGVNLVEQVTLKVKLHENAKPCVIEDVEHGGGLCRERT